MVSGQEPFREQNGAGLHFEACWRSAEPAGAAPQILLRVLLKDGITQEPQVIAQIFRSSGAAELQSNPVDEGRREVELAE
jgi:hypothetical protein